MLTLDISWITLFFALFGLGYLGFLIGVIATARHRVAQEGEATRHRFSLLIPARDEETVLEETLQSLLALRYPAARMEILVVDDGSQDGTSRVVRAVARAHPARVWLLSIPGSLAGKGKAAALNAGFRWLRSHGQFGGDPDWIVGVFDADGRPDPDMLAKVSFQFCDPRVGGVQSTVRIRNHGATWLARMQEVEFAAFARMTQLVRMRVARSASMGGNGQFVRAAALEAAALGGEAGEFWDPRALTEDLELAARFALQNWDLHHLHSSSVSQEGVEGLRALLRQRIRWAWGSLQVFVTYVLHLRVLRAPRVSWRKRVDLLANLSIFLVSPLVLFVWIASALALAGLIQVVNLFPPLFLLVLSFSYLPLVGYGLMTLDGYRKAHLPFDLVGFVAYTYHWIPALLVGLWHVIAGHLPVWRKTDRMQGGSRGRPHELPHR